MKPEIAPIREYSRTMVRELHLLDAHQCFEDYTISECHLLTELDALGEASSTLLAERLVLEKSTVSRLVQGLTDRGELLVRRDANDARSKRLRLSANGRRTVAALHKHSDQQVDRALDFLPEAERSLIVEGMAAYARALRYARLSEQYEIRRIRKKDNLAVAGIIREVMTEFGAVGCGFSINDPEVDDMFSAYQEPRSAFYVVEHAGELQGCGGVAPLTGGEAHMCELRKMYFRPDLRGKGLGARLLAVSLDTARELGFRQCYLETMDVMGQARRLYEKFGFRAVDGQLGNTGHSGCNSYMLCDL